MKGYFAKYIPAVFLFSLVFIFVNAIISFYNLQTLLQNERLINHSEQVIRKLYSINLLVKDMEINQRTYLVTNDPQYLSQFTKSSQQTNKAIDEVRALVKDNPAQVTNVKKLKETFENRVSLLKQRITVFEENGISGVNDAAQNGEGPKTNQALSTYFTLIQKTEDDLLQARTSRSTSSANRTYTTILIATLFNIFLIFITYYLIKRELDYRISMEKRKDEFISIATHELKTPITSLQVFAQILQRKLESKGDYESKQYSTRIATQVSRLTDLINDLLDVSRLQLGKLKFEKVNFNLNELVEEVVEALQQTTDKHTITIKGKIKKQVYGDADRIGQVLTNLISNAIKYSPGGKRIIITLRKDLRHALVEVQDFGIGISDEHKAHVFERFYRAYGESEKNFPGLGMGLFISQEIIRRHRGKLSFVSTEGKGSIFSFTIPYAKTNGAKNPTAHVA